MQGVWDIINTAANGIEGVEDWDRGRDPGDMSQVRVYLSNGMIVVAGDEYDEETGEVDGWTGSLYGDEESLIGGEYLQQDGDDNTDSFLAFVQQCAADAVVEMEEEDKRDAALAAEGGPMLTIRTSDGEFSGPSLRRILDREYGRRAQFRREHQTAWYRDGGRPPVRGEVVKPWNDVQRVLAKVLGIDGPEDLLSREGLL